MNTPGHVVLNLALQGNKGNRQLIKPVLWGALLPDAPMFFFYFVMKLRGLTEKQIWEVEYFRGTWQTFIDVFNSFPLGALGWAIARALENRPAQWLFLSMILHSVFDFPVHHDDGHRHFFPLSDYRFESPVSYWNPKQYGIPMTFVELALVTACSWRVLQLYPDRKTRIWLGVVAGCYLLGFIMAFFFWY